MTESEAPQNTYSIHRIAAVLEKTDRILKSPGRPWLRNRNTVEFLGIWERGNSPDFNYGEFATIRNQAGLIALSSRCS